MAAVTATAQNTAPDAGSPFDQSFNFSIASGDTRVVLVIQLSTSTNPTIDSGPSYDGVSMTEITGSPFTGGGEWAIYGYYIDVSAKSPGSYQLSVSYTNVPDDGVMAAYALSGAGNPTNWIEDTGTATTLIDIAVTSVSGGVVIWNIAQDADATLDQGGGETEAYDGLFTAAGVWYYSSGYYKTATGTTTTSNITMTSGDWGGVGFFIPAAAGGSAIAVHRYLDRQRRR